MTNLNCVVLKLPNAHPPLDNVYVHTRVFIKCLRGTVGSFM